jgi:hypothetical protein
MTELGRIVQVAYAVADVDQAAVSFAEGVGAGPFFVRRHIAMRSATHAGHEATFDHSSAYGQWGRIQVELIAIHDAQPAPLATAVQRTSGIHHVAMFVASFDDERERLERLGWPLVLDAVTGSGARFGFHDAREQLGHLIEIYEPIDRLVAFYASVARAAEGWKGEDPIRET